ncbi:histidine kinase [Sulfuritalea hydrogenivorans]|uniref:ATPase domain-containing protein n=1 Tax=Sulfuritalea hydrogenivorans sk43H TaxID=1223802 RepID=W0SHG7_9PROT|nr:HAMP domain-containing histidine kinase [Sulfuritalea hydrogenivorans]MDK9714875.1 HAMP domain-containing histidine kinase [Sulfuritalea sp.]BAO30799.1 ATPase domain-containing protein [Sulfuritalea hydrogenivorans sk43H]
MPIFPLPSTLSSRLIAVRRGLLLALLLALYFVLLQGPDAWLGKTLFIAHLGLFLLWQPFVHAEQRLSVVWVVGLAAIVLAGAVFLKPWMLLLWIMMLGGIVGGKVMLFGARAPRLFYMMALGFLVVALFVIAAPMAVPMAKPPAPILSLGYVGLPVLLVVMAMLPQGKETDSAREVVDFVYSLFVFLLLAVLMLGSLAAMLLLGSTYVEALLQAMLLTGAMLLLLGLAWNPHSGFSGIGGLFSRYWMSIGLPVEKWLQALSNLALREEDPQVFLERACAGIGQRLPWVTGGEWIAGKSSGRFGEIAGRRWEFSHGGMVLVLYTQHTLSPTLIWHFNLLAQYLAQLHADKQRAQALKQLSYMQAVHETGARLTHDVKNLLQSLNALCSAGLEPGAESSLEYQSLLRRQLPAITDRLAETLAKLNAPQSIASARWVSAAEWWQDLSQRMGVMHWIDFTAESPITGELPAEVFSGVIDNLIRNVAEKHLREPELRAQVELEHTGEGFRLIVCDSGSAMAEDIASSLFVGPVSSESGYGIGLYHAARYAEAAGYRLNLIENRAGRVCFRLEQAA